ncbi:MAG: type IV pilus assembly protein PilM [Proteobacteria bacterium]|nr:type IV pilus assembly protein PilM [Pseudomonadota bacterium]
MFSRPLVAIDIGSSSIKVVEISGGNQKKLRKMGLELLPPGAVVDGLMQDPEIVEGALRTLLKRLKIRPQGRRAALALSGSAVLIKRIDVLAKDNELAEQVYYEAEQQFQADMSEIYVDFFPVEGAVEVGKPQPVLLVGAKRDMVEQYIALIRKLGMRTGVVECAAFSTVNMFEYNYGSVQGLSAVAKIGASVTQVSLLFNGDYVYAREIPIGGDEYSRRLKEALNVDRDNAESLKVSSSQGEENLPAEVNKIIGEINEQLVAELQGTIDYFLQESQNVGVITSVFLTGGGARILGLDAAIAATLHVPVQIINPFQRININSKIFKMENILTQGPLYGVAVGLSLRSLGDHS